MDFKVSKYNKRREMRGATPLEMAVKDEDDFYFQWMTEKDLNANIKNFGPHPELLRGLLCYQAKKLVERPQAKEVEA